MAFPNPLIRKNRSGNLSFKKEIQKGKTIPIESQQNKLSKKKLVSDYEAKSIYYAGINSNPYYNSLSGYLRHFNTTFIKKESPLLMNKTLKRPITDNNFNIITRQPILEGRLVQESLKSHQNRNSEKIGLKTGLIEKVINSQVNKKNMNDKGKMKKENNIMILSNGTILIKINSLTRSLLKNRFFLNHNIIAYLLSFLTISELINIRIIYRKVGRIVELIKSIMNQNVLKVFSFSSQLRMMKESEYGLIIHLNFIIRISIPINIVT